MIALVQHNVKFIYKTLKHSNLKNGQWRIKLAQNDNREFDDWKGYFTKTVNECHRTNENCSKLLLLQHLLARKSRTTDKRVSRLASQTSWLHPLWYKSPLNEIFEITFLYITQQKVRNSGLWKLLSAYCKTILTLQFKYTTMQFKWHNIIDLTQFCQRELTYLHQILLIDQTYEQWNKLKHLMILFLMFQFFLSQ